MERWVKISPCFAVGEPKESVSWTTTCSTITEANEIVDLLKKKQAEWNPPKKYTFSEAYAMMKHGKWMKVVGKNCKYRVENSCWVINDSKIGKYFGFQTEDIDSLWEEVSV